ncbi:MAG: hypothetical protein ACD_48C00173G0002, partial [uncultured bacterium]
RFVKECDGNVEGKAREAREAGDAEKNVKEKKTSTKEQTIALHRIGMKPEQIARMRGIKIETVKKHLEKIL